MCQFYDDVDIIWRLLSEEITEHKSDKISKRDNIDKRGKSRRLTLDVKRLHAIRQSLVETS